MRGPRRPLLKIMRWCWLMEWCFQVVDSATAAYKVTALEYAIVNLTMTNLRTVMGSMDLDELLSKRDQTNAKLLTIVDDATSPWGIKDIVPSHDLAELMARQMKAEHGKCVSILEAEERREAAFRDAEAREREAEAEAKATHMVSQAIARSDVQAINYFVAQKYVEAIKDIASAPNHNVIFMPLEASCFIGALGGVAELTKEVSKKGD